MSNKTEPIAIIGMSCRFPGGANNLDTYWSLLYNGRHGIVEVPPDRWDLEEYYDDNFFAKDKIYTKYGGFLDSPIADFDAKFFNMTKAETDMTDPQLRLSLEITWEALENAGITFENVSGTKTGVFVGVVLSDYHSLFLKSGVPSNPYSGIGQSHGTIAARIAYFFNLLGTCFAIDAGCSSSLIATHEACNSLREGESKLAIACGVNLIITPESSIQYCKLDMLSTDGFTKPFDAGADGLSRGEGAGALILKRLSDAERDGDRIFGVIRGSAINNNGTGKEFTYPNRKAIGMVINEAISNSGLSPSDISYIEAGSTGSKGGDPIEFEALQDVFAQDVGEKHEIVIGSVKTNIGHLEAASGMASIIKTILAMQHETVPRNLNFHKLNPDININPDLDLTIPTENKPWQQHANKRFAGINAYALYGINAHIILEEAPLVLEPKRPIHEERPAHILTLSAKDEGALNSLIKLYIDKMAGSMDSDEPIADICFSANTGRTKFSQKLAIVGSTHNEFIEKLQAYLDGKELPKGIFVGNAESSDTNVIFEFTGSVSHYTNVAKTLAATNPSFDANWQHNIEILKDVKDEHASALSIEYALYQLWLAWGLKPTVILANKKLKPLLQQLDPEINITTKKESQEINLNPSEATSKDIWNVLLEILALCYVQGIEIDWKNFDSEYNRKVVLLPNYPFQRKSYWLKNANIPSVNEAVTQSKENIQTTPTNINYDNDTALIQKIVNAQAHDRKDILSNFLEEELKNLLDLDPATKLDRQSGFIDLGLSSVMAVEYRSRVMEALGNKFIKSLPATLIFSYPNIDSLADYILSEVLLLSNKKSKRAKKSLKSEESIAIIGMACRYPGGANSLDGFWQVLSQEIDAITEIPKERFNVDEFYDPNPDTPEKMYPRGGAFLDNISNFDAEFFGIPPSEALALDPQQRILQEVSWEAIENAGIEAETLMGSKTGVYVGVMGEEYLNILLDSKKRDAMEIHIGLGNIRSALPGRIAYFLGLRGSAMAIDSACSSSLVGIHLACQNLRDGTDDMALAAGVNTILIPDPYILGSRFRAFAFDSHCKTFDANADGYARGEGCGVVVLKRLSDAKRDGDNILAVIRGSAVNQDGRSSSLSAPNGVAQKELLLDALANANVKANEVSYVEAHGTGTPLGDPIEVDSIGKVYSEDRKPDTPLYIGSVKTNIGHTEGAAGIAGVIKTVLALQHKQIPAHLNFHNLNPNINLDIIPAKIPTQITDWPAIDGKRIAGVSSFGMTGTNSHVIIEEYSTTPVANDAAGETSMPRVAQILTMSAKNTQALQDLAKTYLGMLGKDPDKEYFANLCYSANHFRSHFKHGLAVVASDALDAQTKLKAWLDTGDASGVISGERVTQNAIKVAFLFTGQGSQYAGMGKQLYETNARFKAALDECGEILAKYIDKPLISLLWGDDAKHLDSTQYTQPALFALEYALYKLWLKFGVSPQAVIGHSVGEYVAACVAGVFSLEDGLQLIAKRAELMQSLQQNGAMVAIAVSEEEALAAIGKSSKEVGIAAINGPNSVVISGLAAPVKAIAEKFAKQGLKTKELQVSHAFHSYLLEPMLDDLALVVSKIKLSNPTISLISNLTGHPIANDEITKPEYWVAHTRNAVRFADGVRALLDNGFKHFIEIGPQPVLLGMAQESALEDDTLQWMPTLRKSKADWLQVLESLGKLYVSGGAVNWDEFDKDYQYHRVPLPNYPFQRKRYWAEGAGKAQFSNQLHALVGTMSQSALHDNEFTFSSALSLDAYPYMLDHQVFNNVIVPGAAFIEMAVAGITEILKNSKQLDNGNIVSLQNVTIEQPLVLPTEGSELVKEAQIVVERSEQDTSKYSWQILSKQGDKWLKHAHGLATIMQPEVSTLEDIGSIKARCTEELSIANLYQDFRALGLDYGTMFQGLKKLFINDNEALGEVSIASEVGSTKGYLLHPTLLDSALHTILGLIVQANADKEAYLPFAIEQINYYAPLTTNALAYTILQDANDNRVKKADISITDVSGNLLVDIKGFTAVKANRAELLQTISAAATKKLDDYLYELVWREQALAESNQEMPPKGWIVFTKNAQFAKKISKHIEGTKDEVVIVEPPEINATANTYINILTELNAKFSNNNIALGRIVLDFADGTYSNPESTHLKSFTALNSPYNQALLLTQALVNTKLLANGNLIFITQGAQYCRATDDRFNLSQAPIVGLGRVIAIEHPELKCRRIDLDADINFELLYQELNAGSATEDQVAFRQEQRLVPRLIRSSNVGSDATSLTQIKADAYYLITGGLGGLGLEVAKWLIARGTKHLILVGRKKPSINTQQLIDAWCSQGIEIKLGLLDIAKTEDVADIFNDITQSGLKLKGIIHAAGVLDDATIMQQDATKYLTVITPKILGAWNLQTLVEDQKLELDFFVSFSSGASIFGNVGQANYAAANAFLDTLGYYQRQRSVPGISINWGAWAQIGLVANIDKASQEQLVLNGVNAFAPERGIEILEKILLNSNKITEVVALDINWQVYFQQMGANPNSIYAEIAKETKGTTRQLSYDKDNEFIQKLVNAELSERRDILSDYLETELKNILSIDPKDSIDRKSGVTDLGLNSLMAVEFRNKLTKALGDNFTKSLPATLMFNYPTIESLTEYLLSEVLLLSEKKIAKVSKSHATTEPIAIIGLACRYPGGANNLDEYWRVLSEGIDTITEIPKDRFDINDYYDANPDTPGTMYPRGGAFIDRVDNFDAEFFGVAQKEALALDPQQRLLLEISWEALENAGIQPEKLFGTKTGVYIGVMSEEYLNLLLNSKQRDELEVYFAGGNGLSTLAGRISYTFGFQGPAMSIDTVCSSSLVAIHLACQSLHDGTSDLALAAGVNLILTPEGYVLMCRNRALAADSHCKTFDANADGYARGEGCGIVVLKRLSEAIKDKDNILAIIKGSAVNQDGRSGSLSTPNGVAQESLIREALIAARVKPQEVSYVEAHGTGTPLGDPIEVDSIGKVYSEDRKPDTPLYIGSVKTNIGHTEGAAGIAGVIKTVLALQHKQIPAHLNFHDLNPNINLDIIPAKIPTQITDWPAIDGKRIAGVSSFGLTGTNSHVIIEEYAAASMAKEIASMPRPAQILTMSAKSTNALQDLAKTYLGMLGKDPDKEYFANLCYSANHFRSHFKHGLAVVASDAMDAQTKLKAWLDTGDAPGVISGERVTQNAIKVAFLFTGQGSQYAGMGKQLYETNATFKAALDECGEILAKYIDKPLISLLWGDDAKHLDSTQYTQPALFALEYALYKLWLKFGVTPQAVIGHSVGEYVAACVAGVFSLEDGLQLIAKRAELMQSLQQNGAMVAIAVSEEEALAAIGKSSKEIGIAAINGPNSVVISGLAAPVKAIAEKFAKQGLKTKELQVSHAFHSYLLEPMLDDLALVVSKIKLSNPTISLISNLTGHPIANDEITKPEYWVAHTRNAVRFADGVRALLDNGFKHFIEIGPQPVLLGMAQESALEDDTLQWMPTLRKSKADWLQVLESLGKLYVSGGAVNWDEFDKDYQYHRVPLPNYPFQRQKYWIDQNIKKDQQRNINISTFMKNYLGTKVEDRLDYLCNYLIKRINEIMVDHSGPLVTKDSSFVALGLDSIQMFQLRGVLVKALANTNIQVPTNIFFDKETLKDLATYILENLQADKSLESLEKPGNDINVQDVYKIQTKADAKFRLFCFSYAGGVSDVYTKWITNVPHWLDIVPVELPGRGLRASEEPFTNIEALVNDLYKEISPHLTVPAAFFGHSLGALIAFSLAAKVQTEKQYALSALFISSSFPPQNIEELVINVQPTWHKSSIENIIFNMICNGSLPLDLRASESLLEDAEFKNSMDVSLRADLEIFETYKRFTEDKLDIPLIVFYSDNDQYIEQVDMHEWSLESNQEVSYYIFSGDHFYLFKDSAEALPKIVEIIKNIKHVKPVKGV